MSTAQVLRRYDHGLLTIRAIRAKRNAVLGAITIGQDAPTATRFIMRDGCRVLRVDGLDCLPVSHALGLK